MNIAFFCSDHGFGHIIREMPVIEELAHRGHRIVVVCGNRQCEFGQQNTDGDITWIDFHTDVGILVKAGTIILDKEATAEAVDGYIHEFPKRIAFAQQILEEYAIDRVVVDIVPWAIVAADTMGIDSYLMVSFTWLEQYDGYIPKTQLLTLRNAFQSASHILYYDLANERARHVLGKGIEVGFVARKINQENVQQIRTSYNKKIVFLSLGLSNMGLDYEIDVSGLPYDFVTTGALNLIGDNVTYLPLNVSNTHEYIMAADFSISKPGWTTVAEMMISGKRFAVLERPDIQEDTMTIEQLKERKAATILSVDDLHDMGHVMELLEAAPRHVNRYNNEYEKICDILCAD